MPDTRIQRTVDSGDTDAGGAIAHLPALDGVRGIAILLVLFLHFGVGANFPGRAGGRIAQWAERLFYVGWSGVDLFFVLSGFLISSILLATKSDPQYFRRFYGRRVLRIFPLYYVTVALAFIVLPHVLGPVLPAGVRTHLGVQGQLWLWTYTLNLALVFGWAVNADIVGHFWTLAIEEQYYLFWPWVVRRTSRKTLLRVCIAFIAGALALRIGWLVAGGSWEGAYRFTLTRVDAFGVGGVLALAVLDRRSRALLHKAAPVVLAISGAGLLAMFLAVPRFYPSEWAVVTFGHTLLAIAFGSVTAIALRDSAPRWMQSPVLRALGKYSYGIYVWHWPIQRVLLLLYSNMPAPTRAVGTVQATAFLVIGIGASSLSGWASYRVIEAPFLRLKRVFAYTSRPPAGHNIAPEFTPSTFPSDGHAELTKS